MLNVQVPELSRFPFPEDTVYLYLYPETRTLTIETSEDWTFNLYNRLEFRFELNNKWYGYAYKLLLEDTEVLKCAERIFDGWDSEWDGNGFRGTLTEDALLAVDELDGYIETEDRNEYWVWDAEDWFRDGLPELTAGLSDEDFAALEQKLKDEAAGENAYILDLHRYLKALREDVNAGIGTSVEERRYE